MKCPIKLRGYIKPEFEVAQGIERLSPVQSLLTENARLENGYILFYEKLEIMRFTGVKDIQGRDIYEDDIIDTFNAIALERGGQYEIRGVVKYRDDAGYFFLEVEGKFYGLLSRLERPEVIGNVWEHPDLLKSS